MNSTLSIRRHGTLSASDGLSPLQQQLLSHPAPVRIASAPTGAGKSYAFQRAMLPPEEGRILFMVPTRRLAQNLARSLIEDLTQRHGWSPAAAEAKVQIWSSDSREVLRQQGVQPIGPYRIRQIASLSLAFSGGEMIIAIPEVLSYLLLRPYPNTGQSAEGSFHLLNSFSHIVFDEFHTIEARGFGLAALLARIAASGEVRAKVSFLSATPVAIRPVLEQLGLPPEQIVELDEEISDPPAATDRIIHGNVALEFSEAATLHELLTANREAIRYEIEQGRQVVCIYNALFELQRQIPQLQRLLIDDLGLDPNRVLLINSIDDSRSGERSDTLFRTGRQKNPGDFDLLLATASVEMGVTFNADLLLMEPGFSPLNFLQRYGRAARRDHPGRVIVRIDKTLLDRHGWLRQLHHWALEHQGEALGIDQLTARLTAPLQQRFEPPSGRRSSHFGKLSNRACYTSALYWHLLLNHFSSKGERHRRLRPLAPPQLWQLRHLLNAVRSLSQHPLCQTTAPAWCDAFEREAMTLRNIGRRVRIREQRKVVWVSEVWLYRYTDLAACPLVIAEDGEVELQLPDDENLSDHLLDKGRPLQPTLNVLFPTTSSLARLPDAPDLPEAWCREFKKSDEVFILQETYPEAIEAAQQLVRYTGFVVTDNCDLPDSNANMVV